MHLFTLGMVKTIHRKTLKLLKVRSREKSFVWNNRELLTPFVKMDITWLKINVYTGGKFPSWNSEHNLGFVTFMLWFMQNISEALTELPPASIPPEGKPQKEWTKRHNEHWLRQRGLLLKGSAHEVELRVAEAMKQNPIPPIVPIPNVKPDEIQNL